MDVIHGTNSSTSIYILTITPSDSDKYLPSVYLTSTCKFTYCCRLSD